MQTVKRFVLFIFCSFQRPVLLLSLLLYIVIKCAKDSLGPTKGKGMEFAEIYVPGTAI